MAAVILLLCLLGSAIAIPERQTRIVGGAATTIAQYPYMSNMKYGFLAIPERQTRIVGGAATTIAQYPYMSNMKYGFLGIWWYQACGGSLLTTTAILSAAHCYDGDSPGSWRVVLGSTWRSRGGSEHKVSKITINSGFLKKTMVHDVAIVKLQSPAILSSSIQTAKIAGANYALSDGAVVYAVGWGNLLEGGSSSEQLQHVALNVINQKLCADRYEALKSLPGYYKTPYVTSGMFCAGILNVGGKDTCQGDSGGPVAQQGNVIVGITSWGQGCAKKFYPGVNTRVSVYSNWIVNNA